MFGQGRLNLLLEEDFIFSANIVTKILIGKLKTKVDGLDDWVRSLEANELNEFIDYCNLSVYEFTENDEEEELVDVRDLISVIHIILEMETGELHDIKEESLIEYIQVVAVAANLEFLRRSCIIKVLKKGFLHRKDSGLYIETDDDEDSS